LSVLPLPPQEEPSQSKQSPPTERDDKRERKRAKKRQKSRRETARKRERERERDLYKRGLSVRVNRETERRQETLGRKDGITKMIIK